MRRFTLIFIFLIFTIIPLAAEDLSKDNLVVLMDCSGSMEGEKLAQAKTALKEVLSKIPQTTNIGILMFGETRGWLYELGPRDDKKLIAAINNLNAGGSTPLGTYMKISADRLLLQRRKQAGYGTYRLLIITDGEANNEPSGLVEKYTAEIINRGITIDAIGVFMNSNHTLANKVHSYRSANDTESLKKAIYEVLSEVTKTKDGLIEDDAFKVISGLSTETALAILTALPSANNRPIDEGIDTPQKIPQADSNQQGNINDSFPSTAFVIIFITILLIIFIFFARLRKRGSE
jgi:Ca-activated chloride channel family protein